MEKTAILRADILDIVFEGRNKEYGAYDLRRTYNKRMRVSIAVMLLVVLMLCIGQLIAGRSSVSADVYDINDSVKLTKVEIPEEPPVPPPPEVKPPPPRQIETIKVTPPQIVPDDQVKETEMPPVEEQETARIDVVTKKGEEYDGVVAPPAEAEGKGIVEVPKAKEPEGPLVFVQIQSEYPGGRTAWERFLRKNLHYPQAAQDNEIQGTVVVQFIVDKEGNVSEVQAISGPAELRDEAVRVIKKSGKWTPAIQNGNKVPSYKKQPIGFQFVQE